MEAQVLSNELLSDSREAVDPVYEPVTSPARFGGSSGVGVTVGELGSGSQSGKNISRPKCLLAESVQQSDGVGPVVDLDQHCCKLLVVTLGITDVVERTGLTVSVWGSPDQRDWGSLPLLTFRQRQYCGVYSVLLNMAMHPGVRYLRVQWSMNRWGRGERTPQFGFEVFLEESGARVSGSAVA
jgi:hypothetical protein